MRRCVPFRIFFLLALLPVAWAAPHAAAQQDARQDSADVEPPWNLTLRLPGEPFWAPLLRVREAEPAYRQSRQWWGVYAQLRAQTEATAGNHAAALRYWDLAQRPRNGESLLAETIRAEPALDVLSRIADTARVVMINERHHAASDRLLTLRLLPILYERGFRYFAAEAFVLTDSTLNERAYPVESTGPYVDEPVFGALVREALRLGYTLVPYEVEPGQQDPESSLTRQQQRDRAQAENLVERIFRRDSGAKALVHAGYSHIVEEASDTWYPMALYFREMTGIDPVTIDQTRLSERSAPGYEHPVYRAAVEAGLVDDRPVVLFDGAGAPLAPARFAVDVQVFTPRTATTHGRPDWMRLGGRRAPVDLAIPECRARWCFVEARVPEEPPEAVALDRAEVDTQDTVRLFLPTGKTAMVRVFAADGELLRAIEHEGAAERR